jgi:putative transposase
MDWTRILAYVTGALDQELLARNEYLAAENRILKSQLNGRLKLSDAERAMLGKIGHRLGRQALAEVAPVARPDTILALNASLSPVSSMAQKLVEVRADRGLPEKSSS